MSIIIDTDVDVVVGVSVVGDGRDVDFGALFAKTCKEPEAGEPRVPDVLIVDEPELAQQVEALGLGVRVEIDDTPEVDEAIDEFLESTFGKRARPLHPQVSFVGKPWRPAPRGHEKKIEPLGARLMAAAPWKRIAEDVPIRVSAPRHGLADGVVNVFGVLGQSPGLSVFRSPKHLRTFLRTAGGLSDEHRPPPMEDPFITLTLEPRKRGAPEVATLHVRPDWHGIGADQSEVALLVAVAEALVRVGKADTVTHEGVTLTINAGTPVVPMKRASEPPTKKPDRNDPCWCGSGKKYKKCHLDADAATQREERTTGDLPSLPGRSRWGAILDRMYPRILAWCERHVAGFGEHLRRIAKVVGVEELIASTAIFVTPVTRGAPTPGVQFREAVGESLSREERTWLDANIDHAWLSYWTVDEVEPGRSMTMRDIFSGEVRKVIEVRASRSVSVHALACARVVTVPSPDGDESYMDVAHTRLLGPRDALELRQTGAAAAGLTKKKAVPVATLGEPKVALALMETWSRTIRAREQAFANLRLQNTDGHPLILVSERFALAAPRSTIEAALAGLEHLERDTEEAWTLTKPGNAQHADWEVTTLAQLTLERDALVVETNSRERADEVAARLRAALGDALGPSAREEVDPKSLALAAAATPAEPTPSLRAVPAPEVQAALRELKERAYANWADEPVPALGDKTPRQAMKTAEGRRQVEALIDEYEGHESRELPGARFDCDILRRAVGLPSRGRADA
ncbi:MAG: SEC-C domain-containing protein [Deltaproteobacteria bacterium]|nr:SEC-C domain-containing protein [Deltaproteobacteria bacterium]